MFSRYSNFCLDFLVMQKNGLIRKIRFISKSMTPQPGLQTIAIHIFTNILRSKGNQAMKFGQLTEYSMRNIFLEESYTKCGKETIPRLFLKNQNWLYLWINILRFYIFRFNCLPSWGLSKVIETADHLLLPHIKLFKKTKRGLELVSLLHFLEWFLKKNISVVMFYYLTKFNCQVAFTPWDIGQFVYCNCLLTSLWRHRFRN